MWIWRARVRLSYSSMKQFALALSALAVAVAGPIRAAEISFAANTTGKSIEFLQKQVAVFEKNTGNHDQVEAMTLADRICVLRDGVVEQIGTPLELYESPNSLFVAGFIGSPRMNFLSGELAQPYDSHTIGVRAEHDA